MPRRVHFCLCVAVFCICLLSTRYTFLFFVFVFVWFILCCFWLFWLFLLVLFLFVVFSHLGALFCMYIIDTHTTVAPVPTIRLQGFPCLWEGLFNIVLIVLLLLKYSRLACFFASSASAARSAGPSCGASGCASLGGPFD